MTDRTKRDLWRISITAKTYGTEEMFQAGDVVEMMGSLLKVTPYAASDREVLRDAIRGYDAFGHKLRLERADDQRNWIIRSVGPNGLVGDEDDIVVPLTDWER